ncbi:MAG: ABC transporter substrate-binding protein [Deltaproteobacteria bacterium]|nr:ABC transporter substrate-binding protein [Deltaproteobacteria bacterium]
MRRFVLSLAFLLGAASTAFSEGSPEVLKIGATLALSGKFAFIGEAEQRGLMLGVEQANREADGKELLKLIFEDNAADAKTAVQGVRKLLSVDKVDVIFSAFTHVTHAIAPIVAAQGKIMIYEASLRSIASMSPYFFRDYLDMERDAERLANYAAGKGDKQVVYLGDDGEVCDVHEKEFSKRATKLGIKLLAVEEFQSGTPDLKSLLLRSVKFKPDALVVCAWRDTHVLAKQLTELGVTTIPVYYVLAPFLPAADTAAMREIFERQHAVSTWFGFVESEKRPEYQAFRDAYMRRFGDEPRPDAAYAYDDMLALGRAAKVCSKNGAADRDCLVRELSSLQFVGAAGEFSFGPNRISARPSLLMQVQQGEWKIIEQ